VKTINELIYTIKRRDDEELRFYVVQYRKHTYLDIRVYLKPNTDSEFIPSKKGMTFPTELVPLLVQGFDQVAQFLAK